MFQHHLLIAIRNLRRHKSSFFINLVGLGTGLACAFLIYLWVADEWSVDKFHKKEKQLYQVMETSRENDQVIVHEATQGLLGESMAKDLPEVLAATSVFSLQKEGIFLPFKAGDKAAKASGIFATANFFQTFSFPLLQGTAAGVLHEKNNIVLSETLAKNLFGAPGAAIGKTLEWELLGQRKTAYVAGVFASLPANTSQKFDFVFTYDLLLTEVVPNFQKWWNEGPYTYLVLKEGTDIQSFNQKIAGFIKPYFEPTIFQLFVRNYSSAYLYGRFENGVQAGGRIEYVRLFSIVAIFILLIACINFMNLSTARASRRLKEVGIKKTLGSSRFALILQFLTEAVLMAFLSVLLAGVIVALFLPVFNQITGKQLGASWNAQLVGWSLLITFLTGILSGSYPAFYLSAFNPAGVLKGKIKNSAAELFARKGLVIFQFMISLVLIIAVMVIYRQVEYVQSKNLGYDKANVVYFDKEGALERNKDAFLAELKKIPGIVNASAMMQGIVQSKGVGASTYGIDWPGKTEKDLINFTIRAVDYDLVETLGIQVKHGRSFSRRFGSDSSNVLFNESAIRVMGLKDPVGTQVKIWNKDMTIIGVVKDFHLSSLHEPIAPMVFMYNPKNTTSILAKIKAGQEKETLHAVTSLYRKFNPGYVFEYHFLDEAYQAQYVAEQRVSVLSRFFAGLAILISCLGLFGLASFNAEIRTKEIGVRKVLGASVSNIILLLSRDFIRLILLSVIIAFPIAWWAMNQWLDGFAYHIRITADIFILAGMAIVAITLLTIGYQSLRTALRNPVTSLRTE